MAETHSSKQSSSRSATPATQEQLDLSKITCGVVFCRTTDGETVVRGFGDLPDEDLRDFTNAMKLFAAKLASAQRNRLLSTLLH